MNAPFAIERTLAMRAANLADAAELALIEGFVAASGGSVFHRPAWLLAVESGTGNKARGLLAERGGAITGWLPLNEIHSPIFGRMLASSGFAVEGGALADRPQTAEALCRAAEELALRLSCPTIELRGGHVPADWTMRTDSHCGFVAPLAADDETQLLAIPRKQRAEVRRGLGHAMEISTGRGEADRAAHYAVYAQSVRNLGTPVFPRSLFDAVLDTLDADILTVRHEGEPLASVLSLYHDGAVMPYWGGGTAAARHWRANDVMYYALMNHARARGCDRFDFGRSKTGSGAFHFKRNWGFEPQPLAYASWTAPGAEARDADPTSAAHAMQIALWKKLPLAVANRLGPLIARGLG
ncbi:FemAB family PEP-CTERM system-associated protein [Altererythrobacter sp. KTW20L]|uniref:FemAB family XrtA/PEP-CTERM system-associated protein n=1 Tax=Altererythrobacter sp. KTW20L TaxID=2942210 RepID=UPI0020BF8C35|nr:FemAB family XrtA/PEP-CTERM system-associated protein [Altererythrobacter sp. KTW20L]MCL6251877.1 FemAB family PEP-CTERM system-associated protein [Altererythrobacter sp. KTW20L]